MRGLFCIVAIGMFSLIAPAVDAQSAQNMVPGGSVAADAPQGYQAAAPDPGNCGTPGEPKPCPPMPRHPLRHYPHSGAAG